MSFHCADRDNHIPPAASGAQQIPALEFSFLESGQNDDIWSRSTATTAAAKGLLGRSLDVLRSLYSLV